MGKGFDTDQISPPENYQSVFIFAIGSGIRPFTILVKGLFGTARSSLFLYTYCTSAWLPLLLHVAVIKPSELTPLTALAAAKLAHQSGIPPYIRLDCVSSVNQVAARL